jgi:thiamine transport system substrate-binding protein
VKFKEGHPIQVEGAAMLASRLGNDAESLRLAKQFLEFLLTPTVQKEVPKRNWMMPVVKGTPLPGSFQGLPPLKILKSGSLSLYPGPRWEELLSQWRRAIEQ